MSPLPLLARPSSLATGHLVLRTALARRALADLFATLRQTGPLIIAACGPVLLGALALLALPLFEAATRPALNAIGAMLAQGLLVWLPFLALRRRLLPDAYLAWEQALPITMRQHRIGDALAALLALKPLAFAYALSASVWLWQSPEWLQPVRFSGIALIAGSLVVTGLLLATTLTLRRKAWRIALGKPAGTANRQLYRCARRSRWQPLLLLLVLPFWRGEGRRVSAALTLLISAAIAIAWAWPRHFGTAGDYSAIPPLLIGTAMMTATVRADRHLRELWRTIAPVIAAWPLSPARLIAFVRCLALLPAAVLLVSLAVVFVFGFSHPNAVATTAFLATGAAACTLVVFATRPATAARQASILLALALLTAIGNSL